MLAQWSRLKLDCDLLLVSSHFGAHGATIHSKGPSLVYYHSPMRTAWRPDIESARFHSIVRPIVSGILPLIRRFDARVANYPDVAVANSHATAQRIKHVYGRPATVVHPPVVPLPVGWAPPQPDASGEPYYLYFGRLVPYKRPDLAMAACEALGRRLVIAGYGPMLDRLRRVAGSTTTFVERPGVDEKWRLLAGARALLFPGEEDFGIVPVEALAVGTPVVGLGVGGILDSVDSPHLGELFFSPTVEAVKEALLSFERRSFDSRLLQASAERFSTVAFKAGISHILEQHDMPLPNGPRS